MQQSASRYVVAVVVLIAIGSASRAAIIYVDDSATRANNGTSWTDAFTDLAAGLKSAQPGDEVRIGGGTYKPAGAAGDRTASFILPNATVVQGGYAGAGAPKPDALDPKQFPSILSGDLNGDDGAPGSFENQTDNSYSVVSAISVNDQTQLRGVTIQGGNADDFDGCMPTDDLTQGGGLIIINSQLQVINVTFIANQAVCTGGAISSDENSSPKIQDCAFSFNQTNMAEAGWGAGAAIGAWGGALHISNCTFENNGQATAGGAIHSFAATEIRSSRFAGNVSDDGGGAISGGDFNLIDCQFIDNTARTWGGAANVSNSKFVNCTFLNNTCATSPGGAIKTHGGGISMVNCLVAGNKNIAIVLQQGSFGGNSIVNCTVVGNAPNYSWPDGPSGLAASGSLTIANTILWDNQSQADDAQDAQLSVSASSSKISHSIIEGWDGTLGGDNNSGKDPELVDPDGLDNIYGTEDDNAHLSETSPAINTGNNGNLPADEFDLDNDANTSESIPLDLDQNTRIVKENVDMGPYESGEIGPGCATDVAPDGGNGVVDVDDLLLVVNNWGATGGPADITGNGIVDVDDLLAVVNAWGPCE